MLGNILTPGLKAQNDAREFYVAYRSIFYTNNKKSHAFYPNFLRNHRPTYFFTTSDFVLIVLSFDLRKTKHESMSENPM